MAHEFGHIVQFHEKSELPPMLKELQSDYLAGWYVGRRRNVIPTDVDEALTALFKRGDFAFNSESHHGILGERIESVAAGFQSSSTEITGAYDDAEHFVRERFGGKRLMYGRQPNAYMKYLMESLVHFNGFKGTSKKNAQGVTYWMSKMPLPGAKECHLYVNENLDLARCIVTDNETDEAQADAKYEEMVRRATQDLKLLDYNAHRREEKGAGQAQRRETIFDSNSENPNEPFMHQTSVTITHVRYEGKSSVVVKFSRLLKDE